jgi:hypothetical protein
MCCDICVCYLKIPYIKRGRLCMHHEATILIMHMFTACLRLYVNARQKILWV